MAERDDRTVDPILQVEGLVARFMAGPPVLDGVDLELRRGESVAIVGRSGSGKSTLLSSILGLVSPAAGSIYVAGLRMDVRSPRARAKIRRECIGTVFQSGALLPELSPEENVVVAGVLCGLDASEAQDRARLLLARLGVPDAPRLIGSFSGGEQQRVALARALINRPKLLVADEPTASLDPETRDEVCALLAGLPEQYGCAMVLVTHAPEVAGICHRIENLVSGRLAPAVASRTM